MEPIIKIAELNGGDLLRDYSEEIERMLGSKMKSVKVKSKTLQSYSRALFIHNDSKAVIFKGNKKHGNFAKCLTERTKFAFKT